MAPLVALEAGRRLAAGVVDTNSKRFSSGLLDQDDFWRRVCADRARLLLSIGRSYFNARKLKRLPVVTRYFSRDRTFQDNQLSYGRTFPITFYKRNGDTPCEWSEPSAPSRNNRGR